MKKQLTKRIRGFLIFQLPFHAIILIILWLALHVRIWLIFFLTYLGVITAGFIYEVFRAWKFKQQRIYANEMQRLLLLLRNIIDLAFIHDEYPEKFYNQFLAIVSVESLRSRGIIDPDALLLIPKYNRTLRSLRLKDAELWTLMMAGFKSRELKVIYGLANLNSVYVKCNRLKNRLDTKTQELLDGRDFPNIQIR